MAQTASKPTKTAADYAKDFEKFAQQGAPAYPTTPAASVSGIAESMATPYLSSIQNISRLYPTISPEAIQVALSGPMAGGMGYTDASQLLGLTPEQVTNMNRGAINPFQQLASAGQIADTLYGRSDLRKNMAQAYGNTYQTGVHAAAADAGAANALQLARAKDESDEWAKELETRGHLYNTTLTNETSRLNTHETNETRKEVAKVTFGSPGQVTNDGSIPITTQELTAIQKIVGEKASKVNKNHLGYYNDILAWNRRLSPGIKYEVVTQANDWAPNKTEMHMSGLDKEGNPVVYRQVIIDDRPVLPNGRSNPNYKKKFKEPQWEQLPSPKYKIITPGTGKSGQSSLPAYMLQDMQNLFPEGE